MISRHGDEVEVEASLWVSTKLGGEKVWNGSFKGSRPNSQVPALQEVPVTFTTDDWRPEIANRWPMKMTLIFLQDGYLR
jgi:hypothetical protein